MGPNSSLSDLFSKQGLVTIQLAGNLLRYQPGDQIARAQDYSREFHVGAGTVQAALEQLLNSGVIKLNARGRLGTYIEEIDYIGLWHFTIKGPVICSMPLPYSRRYEGLATGLSYVFSKAGVPLNINFVRGSLNRLNAVLHSRNDFFVVSGFAIRKMIEDGQDVAICKRLGVDTWIEDHVLVFRDPEISSIQTGMRIGVDRQSVDHEKLVERACAGRQVELVDLGYMQSRSALLAGQIDATVWNIDDFALHPEPSFKMVPAREAGFGDLYNEYSEAVIAIKKSEQGISNLLNAVLDIDQIKKIQREVIAGNRLPAY